MGEREGFDVLGDAEGPDESCVVGDELIVAVGRGVGDGVTGARVGVADGLDDAEIDGLALLVKVGDTVGLRVTGARVG